MYCVNTGYTVFKLVEVIDGNNEYYILKQSLSHGVSIYDRIILDADKYSENEMIYKAYAYQINDIQEALCYRIILLK